MGAISQGCNFYKDQILIESLGCGIRKIQTVMALYPEIELPFGEVGPDFQVKFIKKRLQSMQRGQNQGKVEHLDYPAKIWQAMSHGPILKLELAR